MTEWNFDINKAPHDKPVITASHCGKVIISRWVEEGERWNMYAKDVPPIAWQPYPEHPTAKKECIDLNDWF